MTASSARKSSLSDLVKGDNATKPKEDGSDPVLVDDNTYAEPVKTQASKDRTQASNDVPVEDTSAADKEHNYKDLEKGTFDDQKDSKSGVTGKVVPIVNSNAVHNGITDNYPNDFEVPLDYPANEGALTTRTVTESFYAAPAQTDDKGLGVKEAGVTTLDPKTGEKSDETISMPGDKLNLVRHNDDGTETEK